MTKGWPQGAKIAQDKRTAERNNFDSLQEVAARYHKMC